MTSPRIARFHPVADDHAADRRSAARRDRDRILYSSAFRRLSGITQVISASDRHPIHNRLTHTLEVAQIGRSLAEELLRSLASETLPDDDGLDPDVVEAACLAHDLGHPPFGHVAEEELNRIIDERFPAVGGYEGNAQTFRIVTKLSTRYREYPGLNLTRATLRAILKYPWPRGETGKRARKWGAYASESNDFRFAMELAPRPETRSLEAEIMDWADDIAYAIHDVEDFYRAGIIPLDRLATDHRERERFLGRALARQRGDDEFTSEELRARFEGIMAVFPLTEPYAGNHEHRARLRSFTSWLIDRYVRATSLARDGNAASALSIIPTAKMEVAVLKALTWHYVIESPALISQRYGQRQLISSLFGILFEAAQSPRDRRVFPEFYREQIGDAPDDATIVRTVADLISSMTESQVVEMHHRLTGISLGGALDPIVS